MYVPATAKRAVENYFSPGNLTALRELALRRTAQRVDEQLLNHMQAHAIPGPWAAGDRVLVCIDERPRGASLVRYARRQAERLRAPWAVLYIETSRSTGLSEADRDRLAATLRLAEQLGAEAVTLPGQNVAEDIVRYAAANNVTHIITGKPHQPRWWELFEGSVAHDLIRHAGNISVHVVSAEEREQGPESRGVIHSAAAALRRQTLPAGDRLRCGCARLRHASLPRARCAKHCACLSHGRSHVGGDGGSLAGDFRFGRSARLHSISSFSSHSTP